MTGLTEARAALDRGRSVIVVAPPAVEHAEAVWELLGFQASSAAPSGSAGAVVVCADAVAAEAWADGVPPLPERRVHPVTALGHTQRVLQSNPPEILAGAAKDLAALLQRSALKLGEVPYVVVAWPEAFIAEHGEALDTLLAEAGAARRIILSWDPRRIETFLERHAHRAPLVGTAPVDADGRPAPPIGPASFAVIRREQRVAAARDALDMLNVPHPFIWRRGRELPEPPVDLIVCLDLPSRDEFASLSRLAPPLLFLSGSQLPYAHSIASPLVPFLLPSEADRARDRGESLRAEVAEVLEHDDVDAELALLDPLFARYDPAQVAAALLAISRQPSAISHQPSAVSRQPSAVSHQPSALAWAKLFVSVGKKDRVSAKDLVGVLIREAGLVKEQIGKIEVRETFVLVEVTATALDKAVRGLTGAKIRGRRVTARPDRAP